MREDINIDELAGILSRSDAPRSGSGSSGFAPAEIRALRWERLRLLDHRVHLRQIARDSGISLCKITSGARELKRTGSTTRHIPTPHHNAQAPEGPAR